MHRTLFFLFLSSCFLAAEPALVLSESSLATRIHSQNPDLRAARWKIEEALGRLQQAGRPGRPRLNVEWEQDGHIRERELRVGVSRSFPVTQRLVLEKSIGKAEVDAAEKEVRRVEQSLVQQARLAFFSRLSAKKPSEFVRKAATRSLGVCGENERSTTAGRSIAIRRSAGQVRCITIVD